MEAGVPRERFLEFSCGQYNIRTLCVCACHVTAGHVIESDQLLPLALSKGPSGYSFNFNYEQRKDKEMVNKNNFISC